jgi:hypothetical protein
VADLARKQQLLLRLPLQVDLAQLLPKGPLAALVASVLLRLAASAPLRLLAALVALVHPRLVASVLLRLAASAPLRLLAALAHQERHRQVHLRAGQVRPMQLTMTTRVMPTRIHTLTAIVTMIATMLSRM